MPSSLEQSFVGYWRLLAKDLPPYESEYQFHKPRRWRVDFAWPENKVAVELEGAVWTGGRHTRGSGFVADVEKYNQLTLDGFRLLRFHKNLLDTDPKGCIDAVRTLILNP